MKKRLLLIPVTLLTLGAATPAIACEFHGGFGPPGAAWKPYNFDQTPLDQGMMANEDAAYSPMEKTIDPKKVEIKKSKPVFSHAASRASFAAKARIKKKSEDKTESDSARKTVAVVLEQDAP